jgi:anti-sigma factor RsiW
MNCARARESLPLHLTGELEEEGDFLSHLALCPACSRRAELTRVVWDLAGLAPDEPVPDAALQGLYDRIDRTRRRPQRILLTLLRLGTVAAAALILYALGAPAVPPPAAGDFCSAEGPGEAPRQEASDGETVLAVYDVSALREGALAARLGERFPEEWADPAGKTFRLRGGMLVVRGPRALQEATREVVDGLRPR